MGPIQKPIPSIIHVWPMLHHGSLLFAEFAAPGADCERNPTILVSHAGKGSYPGHWHGRGQWAPAPPPYPLLFRSLPLVLGSSIRNARP